MAKSPFINVKAAPPRAAKPIAAENTQPKTENKVMATEPTQPHAKVPAPAPAGEGTYPRINIAGPKRDRTNPRAGKTGPRRGSTARHRFVRPARGAAPGPVVEVNARGERRIDNGHPWIYRSDIHHAHAKEPGPVTIMGPKGRPLAAAFFNPASEITLRVCVPYDGGAAKDARTVLDVAWLKRTADAALEWRKGRGLITPTGATRLIHGEADGLPGIIVDKYAGVCVLQTLNQTAETFREALVAWLRDRLQPKAIVERNDTRVREHENLPLRKGALYGSVSDAVMWDSHGLVFAVDVLNGQKTGAFLDQRENHLVAAGYARGAVLDCFSYQGGFALHCARHGHGVTRVTAVESSENAAAEININAQRNGISDVAVVTANVFDFLRECDMQGWKYDTIILDPPAFAKAKDARERARAGYKEINLRALKALHPGGVLFTCTCSHHVGWAEFEGVVAAAAGDARRRVQLLERRGAALDHPERVGFPEGSYLKCLVLRAL